MQQYNQLPPGYVNGKFYKYKKMLWIVARADIWRASMEGPFCEVEECHHQMNTYGDFAQCANDECNHQVKIIGSLDQMRNAAAQKYIAEQRKNWAVESLDLPPTSVKAGESDQNYWIKAKLGQKNGKEFGVVYLGRNTNSQSDKDKAQFFVDLEDEEVRHDPNNQFPGDVIASIQVKFKGSTTESTYKKEE